MEYSASRDRQWHMYSTQELPRGIRRLFLRALVRQPRTAVPTSPQGTMRVAQEACVKALEGVVEEVGGKRADAAHVFLSLLGAVQMGR